MNERPTNEALYYALKTIQKECEVYLGSCVDCRLYNDEGDCSIYATDPPKSWKLVKPSDYKPFAEY